jgi:ABC-type polysaccharide/polyol phosphate export permease
VLWGVFVTVFRVKLVDGAQFAPYVLSGVLLVTLFVQGVQQCADSLQVNSSVFMKIRVPPHIFALASTFTNGVNFLFGLQALVVVSILSGAGISLRVVLIGFLLITMIVMIVGIGLFLTVCYIRFDDIRNIVAVLLSMLTFLTPVFYPIDILNPIARFIVNLNPLTSGLDIFRFLLSDTGKVTTFDFCYLSSFAILVFYCGFQFFAKQLPRTVSML